MVEFTSLFLGLNQFEISFPPEVMIGFSRTSPSNENEQISLCIRAHNIIT